MDRASASEAGNMGSTPVGRKFENHTKGSLKIGSLFILYEHLQV